MIRIEESIYKLFLFWYVCGVILLSFDLLPSWLEWANAFFLMLAGVLAVIYFLKCFGHKNGLLITAIIFLFSFSIEFAGATFDILFGQYDYTHRFAPNFLDVPIAIGFAWLFVMGTSHAIANIILPKKALLRPVVGATIAVVIDLIIDPVAYKVKEYWVWKETGFYYDIPLTNFIGWFIVAFILHIAILLFSQTHSSNVKTWEKRMIILFTLMISMFLILGVIGQLWLAVSVTGAATVIILILIKMSDMKSRSGTNEV